MEVQLLMWLQLVNRIDEPLESFLVPLIHNTGTPQGKHFAPFFTALRDFEYRLFGLAQSDSTSGQLAGWRQLAGQLANRFSQGLNFAVG